MPAKWSRPVFSFRFYEGKISLNPGVLPAEQLHRWCIDPTRRIVAQVRRQVPGAKVIGFPRGAGTSLLAYAQHVAVDAIGLDWTIEPIFARSISPCCHLHWRAELFP
jgi:uroporphyrinogen-III decarboxylase